MKSILIDLIATQPMKQYQFHGGGNYCKSIFLTFMQYLRESREELDISVMYLKSLELDYELEQVLQNNSYIRRIELSSINDLINKTGKYEFDSFFCALPFIYLRELEDIEYLNNNIKNKYMVIHDVRELEVIKDKYNFKYFKPTIKSILFYIYRTLFKYKIIKKRKNIYHKLHLIKNLNLILVSNFTKHLFYYHFPEFKYSRLKVFYSPPSLRHRNLDIDRLENERTSNLKPQEYLLMLHGQRWLKNCYRVMLAIDSLCNKNLIVKKLVILGVSNPKAMLKNIKNKDMFIFLPFVSEAELDYLYRFCFAFIYPSLAEGFGYPPIEAMKYNKPVLSSSTSSLNEVLRDYVIYFNPYSVSEIASKLLMITKNDTVYEEYSKKAAEYYPKIRAKQEKDTLSLIKLIIEG